MEGKPGHHLKTLRGAIVTTWHRWPEWGTIAAEVADWADCQPNEVKEIETPGGTFITAQGVPVAYMDHTPVVALQAAE